MRCVLLLLYVVCVCVCVCGMSVVLSSVLCVLCVVCVMLMFVRCLHLCDVSCVVMNGW